MRPSERLRGVAGRAPEHPGLVSFALLGGAAVPGLRRSAQRVRAAEQRLRAAERRVRRERIRRYMAARDRTPASTA